MLVVINIISKVLSWLWPAIRGVFVLVGTGLFFIIHSVLFPVYRVYVSLLRFVSRVFEPAKNKVLYPFVSKYFLHLILILLVIFTATNNLYANTKPIVTGSSDHILLASVVGYVTEEEIVEENLFLDQEHKLNITNYLKSAIGLQELPSYVYQTRQQDQFLEFSNLTAGGSALSKPLISSDYVPPSVRSNRAGSIEYVVQAGDTIGGIAESFGLNVTTLLWENNLSSRSYIKPGQKLTVLPTDGITYRVKSGDNISRIASRYGVDSAKILDVNRIYDASSLRKGQELILPGAKPIRVATPVRKTRSRPSRFTKIKDWLAPKSKVARAGGKLLWPTKGRYITQYFSWRHTGLDIDGITGDPLYASEAGIVERAGWGRGYGWHVVINHQNGIKTRYGHMVKYLVKKGQRVSKGQVIGLMGSSGWSTGSHLHYEVIVNGRRRNPLSYTRR